MKNKLTALFTKEKTGEKSLHAKVHKNQNEAIDDITDNHKERTNEILMVDEVQETTVELVKGVIDPFLSFLNKFVKKWSLGDVIKIDEKKK